MYQTILAETRCDLMVIVSNLNLTTVHPLLLVFMLSLSQHSNCYSKPAKVFVPIYRQLKLEDSYFDRDAEKAFMTASKELFEQKTKPSLKVANQVGNMYTPSVYSSLCSFIAGYVPSL